MQLRCGRRKCINSAKDNGGKPRYIICYSNEIRDKVLENAPELADQFLPVDFSNYDFTEGVKENLETLVGNLGIDIRQFRRCITLCRRDSSGNQANFRPDRAYKSFANISATDKAKLSGVKAIVLFSRFGITSTCAAIGSVAGGLIGPLGAPVGGILER